MPSPMNIVKKAYKLGQPAVTISDHGVMFGTADFYDAVKTTKKMKVTVDGETKEVDTTPVKAIAAFEAYVVSNHKMRTNEGENAREHLLLLAKNKEGYKKLIKWCSVGATEGFYYRPRIDDEVMMETGTEGVIASSACLGGRIAQKIIHDDMYGAKEAILKYANMFEEFYLEIQPTAEPDQVKVNKALIDFSKELGLPLLATTDFHYLDYEDKSTHDVLLAMQSGKLVDDPTAWKFKGNTYYVASRAEIEKMFNENGHEILDKNAIKQALDNTVLVAEKCNFELETGTPYLPAIQIPEDKNFQKWRANKKDKGTETQDYLKYLCIKGLKEKGLTDEKYRERLDFELNIINTMGYTDYFLVYADIMAFCHKEDIPVGPGRGCFFANSICKTQNGDKLIQDVKLGDIIIGHDEQPHEVLTTFEYDCDEECAHIETINGKEINCTKDHKIYAIKYDDWQKGVREPQWYSAKDLEENDMIAELED